MENACKITFEASDFPSDILPKPVGWRMLIAPVEINNETSGGILIPSQAKEVMEYFRSTGKVLAMGSECYRHEKFNGNPWCAIGDIVQYSQYAGKEIVVAHDDSVCKLKLINDDEVLTVVKNPEALNFL